MCFFQTAVFSKTKWLSPLSSAGSRKANALAMHDTGTNDSGKPKLVSLLANWISGATLFTILLDAHSQIVSNGESLPFGENDDERYDCSCGKYIDECEFYSAAAGHMRLRDGSEWDRSLFMQLPTLSKIPVLRSFLQAWMFEGSVRNRIIDAVPAYRDTTKRFLDAQLRFFENARSLAGVPIYLDGTKSTRRAQLLARDGRSEMKVIHMIRDGRGFSSSYLKNWSEETRDVAVPARLWLRYISEVDKFAAAFPSVPLLTVRYEDLCRSTTETMKAVYRFLEVPYEEFDKTAPHTPHLLGNRMRRDFDGTIREDTSWKTLLDARTQRRATSIMEKGLRRFGYL